MEEWPHLAKAPLSDRPLLVLATLVAATKRRSRSTIFEKDGGKGNPAIRKKQDVRGWTLQLRQRNGAVFRRWEGAKG